MDHRDEEEKKAPFWQKRQLALALAGTALLALIVSSLAWLNFNRTLQTITRMQMPILYLQEKDPNEEGQYVNTHAIDLGNLDMSKAGSKEIPFAVMATADTKYILQLAYTHNLDLTYELYKTNTYDTTLSDQDKPIAMVDRTPQPSFSYEEYGSRHNAAVPKYEQTRDSTEIKRFNPYYPNNLHFYVLKVTWSKPENLNTKETDMLYLTVATANEEIAPTTSATTGGGA